ncbi:MAG: hypothetical protein LBH96_01580 [Candidatus Peribacteria bacterium]|nr:hypothetical protein [Candidatus Peribacteria bacterium]
MKKHFQQQDENELKKKNLFPFYKYNNHHFYKCGGKHFNDKLPNGEIEYLTACIEKQKKLLGNFIDCLVLAYEFTKVESRNEMLEILAYEFTTVEGRNETLEVKEITLKTFPKCKFVYNTIRPEHLKEISDYRRYYIL